MSLFGYNHNSRNRRPSWQDYQKQLHRSRNFQKGHRWIPVLIASLASVLAVYLGWTSKSGATAPLPEAIAVPHSSQAQHLSQKDVQLLLSHARIKNLKSRHIQMRLGQQQFDLQTSLDMDLQNYLLDAMDRRNSRYIAAVIMDPDSGRILALAGFNKSDPDTNPCMDNQFPAASIFKIVTAAAAVEVCGLKPDATLEFNGDKYTLYKSQLKDRRNRYTNTMSFQDSFAQSVNPVFGKLGMGRLKKSVLEQYGEAFGFNQSIGFELPMPPSRLEVKDIPYHWAEIASGFNNATTLSPVHAAVMVSAVLNQGEMVLPSVVDSIVDGDGKILYKTQRQSWGRAMTESASQVLTQLMEATVKSGTARKAFRNQNRDRVLAELAVGGKTGSIYNQDHDVRFDWFVGFARQKTGSDQLVVAVLVGHEDYIGIRAATYARMAMRYYFSSQLAHLNGTSSKKDNDS